MPTASHYLAWLDHSLDPPSTLSIRGWQVAGGELIERMRAARNRITAAGSSWKDVEDWLIAERKFNSLNLWADFSRARTPRLHDGSYEKGSLKLAQAQLRLARSSARHRAVHVLRGWLRRRKNALSAEQKRLTISILDEWKDSLTQKAKPLCESIASRHYRRELDYSLECREHGLWLSKKQAAELPKALRQQARRNAKWRGQAGWFVAADTDLGQEALCYLTNRTVREGLWRQRQQLRESDATILPMLAARHAEAVAGQHTNYASLMLFDRAIKSPRKVLNMLGDSLDGLRAVNRLLEKRLQEEAAKWGIKEVSPWDRKFLLERIRMGMRFSQEPCGAFPVEQSIFKIIPEIMVVGGWHIERVNIHGTDARRTWQWVMRRKDGRRAQLWVAPFNPNEKENQAKAGEMSLIRPQWNGDNETAESIVSIELSVNRHEKCFSHQDLIWLCHEAGHALHYLAMAGGSPDEPVLFADDLVEFPSQLLERYAHDPLVLARWASSTGPAIARRPSFWRQHMNTMVHGVDDQQRYTFSAWLDLATHQQRNPDRVSLEAIHQKGCERFSRPSHPEDRRHFRSFMWGDYAATDYTYPFGLGMADMLTPQRLDGSVDSIQLAAIFSSLLDVTLSQGVDAKRFAKYWQEWMGEPIQQTIRRGQMRRTSNLRRLTRAVAKA
jgi:Zn-dependent oligopeptidase